MTNEQLYDLGLMERHRPFLLLGRMSAVADAVNARAVLHGDRVLLGLVEQLRELEKEMSLALRVRDAEKAERHE